MIVVSEVKFDLDLPPLWLLFLFLKNLSHATIPNFINTYNR
jgi:hypothetical protein